MELPLALIIIPYIIGLIIFIIAVIFNIWHLHHFTLFDGVAKAQTAAFVLFCVLILGLTIYALRDVDWLQTLNTDLPFIGLGSDESSTLY